MDVTKEFESAADDIFNKVRDMLSINENDEKFDNILNELWPNGIKI